MTTPFWTYLPEYQKEKQAILQSIDKVLESGKLILGPEVARFERQFARFLGVKYGIGVASGTDALFLSLKALGVGPGDEVITVPNTAIPTVSAIVATGARPVFVDVKQDTLLMDPSKLEATITQRTRVVLPVHLYGQCCQMDKIISIAKKHLLFVLEDCAQATGAEYQQQGMRAGDAAEGIPSGAPPSSLELREKRNERNASTTWEGNRGRTRAAATIWKQAGSMGDIAAFSFYPTKIIGAYGDAGMVVTNSASLSKKVKLLRVYGTKGEYYAYVPGFNSRLDEIQAAILLRKLGKINSYIVKRRVIAKHYTKALSKTPLTLPATSAQATHVFHLYVVRHRQRQAIMGYLKRHGIEVKVHYPHPLHLMPAFKDLGYQRGDFPVAEQAAKQVFSLPIYPGLGVADQQRIVKTLINYFRG